MAVAEAQRAAILNSLVDAAVDKEMAKREKEKDEERQKALRGAEEAPKAGCEGFYSESQSRVIQMATRDVLADDVDVRDPQDLREALGALDKDDLIKMMSKCTETKGQITGLRRMTKPVLVDTVVAELETLGGAPTAKKPQRK